MDVTVRIDTSSFVRDIEAMTAQFIEETVHDPDMAARSADFRDGYAQGFREALWAFLRLKAQAVK